MELDELKNTWDEANNQPLKEKNLTVKMVDLITQDKYRSKTKKLIYPELIGLTICLLSIFYIAANFHWLNTMFLKMVAVGTMFLLLAISLISLLSIRRIAQEPDMNKSYAETLREFAVEKLRFFRLQKLNVTLCYLLLVGVVILLSKIVNGVDVSTNKYYWTFSFTIGYLFLMFYSRWVTRVYKRSLQDAQELLKDLG